MFRNTVVRAASHQARQPSIKFPNRDQDHSHHDPAPHPMAPQAIIDAFPSFLKRLSESSKASANSRTSSSSSSSSTEKGPSGASAPSEKPKSSTNLPAAEFEGEWEMPKRFWRIQYSPTEDEIEAVQSGGASIAPRMDKSLWYNAQI